MHYTIEALLKGGPVESWYRDAARHWDECLEGVDQDAPEAIARVASGQQFWFEEHCGGRFVGQEVMVVSAIGRLYTTKRGFGDELRKAKAMVRGLLRSTCSVEIHHHTRAITTIYDELETALT